MAMTGDISEPSSSLVPRTPVMALASPLARDRLIFIGVRGSPLFLARCGFTCGVPVADHDVAGNVLLADRISGFGPHDVSRFSAITETDARRLVGLQFGGILIALRTEPHGSAKIPLAIEVLS